MSEMTGSPVRWGILSTAKVNEEVIGPLRRSPTSELIAVASRDPDLASAYAAAQGIERSYGTYGELLEDDDVEVVYIPLPNGLHGTWIRACLEAGKHVFCEKPFTPSAREAEELFALADRKGLLLAEAVMYRHHPQTARLQQIVREELGEIRSFHASFHYLIPALEDDVRTGEGLGGGVMRDGGSYCVSICNLLADAEPVEVVGRATRRTSSGFDVGFSGLMVYPDGIGASFDVSMDTTLGVWLVVTGSRRTLRSPNPFQPSRANIWAPGPCPAEAWLVESGAEERVILGGESPFLHEIEDYSRMVRGTGGYLVPAAETVRNMRTIERLVADAERYGSSG
jgi:predicted dehydrogenase